MLAEEIVIAVDVGTIVSTRRMMPRMRLQLDDRQFAKVLVEGHQDAILVMGSGEDLAITWIDGPVAGPHDIVTGRDQDMQGWSPHARVKQNLHDSEVTRCGSIRSRPTSLRAYARQARMSSRSSHG